jgi:hypothetical protein
MTQPAVNVRVINEFPRLRALADQGMRAILMRFGAFVRRRAQTSMRYRERASNPGEPPSAHTGLLRDFIRFSVEDVNRSVVIGAMKTNQVFFDNSGGTFRPVTGTGASVLEYGGQVTMLEWLRKSGWQRADLRSLRRFDYRKKRFRTITIAPRPYMRPAFAAELNGSLGQLLQDNVLKGRG